MPKSKKRRKLDGTHHLSLLSNLTGFDDHPQRSNSLDECLRSFNRQPGRSAKPSKGEIPVKYYGNQNLQDSSRVEAWNRSFLSWVSGMNYTPGLLPNIDEEIARNFKVKELSSFLLQSCDNLRMPAFERWLLDSKAEEMLEKTTTVQTDPVVPLSASPQSEASQRLLDEIYQVMKDKTKGEKIMSELCRRTNMVCQELTSCSDRYYRQSPLNKGDRVEIENHDSDTISILYSRKKWKKPFCFKINKEHHAKLQSQFFEIHNGETTTVLDSGNQQVFRSFNILVLSLLLRYSALSGGQLLQDLRGGGMQGAIHNEVFGVLEAAFRRPWLEGFASPFNACLQQYCSAFPDIEWHFGSIGNFMDCSLPQGGCCEVNPPFSPGLMNQMSIHLIKLLTVASQKGVSLTFAVVVPTANNLQKSAVAKQSASASFTQMTSSNFCTQHLILPARQHGYIEGSQHLRPTRFKESTYDTSFILLESIHDTSIDMKKLEINLQKSFASRHRDEITQRKNRSEKQIMNNN
eukprot:scaffold9439_cov115-Cylindrotheca_fusiformis.AAC.12